MVVMRSTETYAGDKGGEDTAKWLLPPPLLLAKFGEDEDEESKEDVEEEEYVEKEEALGLTAGPEELLTGLEKLHG